MKCTWNEIGLHCQWNQHSTLPYFFCLKSLKPAICEFQVQFSAVITLRPGQNGCHFADDIFKCIFLNENVWTPIKISLKFVPKGPINNIPALVQIMAWRRPGDKPLSETMMVRLPTHIWVTQPQWVITWSIFTQILLNHWGRVTHIYASVKQSSFVQIMAFCLISTKPLSEPLL